MDNPVGTPNLMMIDNKVPLLEKDCICFTIRRQKIILYYMNKRRKNKPIQLDKMEIYYVLYEQKKIIA